MGERMKGVYGERDIRAWRAAARGVWLTRNSLHSPVERDLVPPNTGAESLVADANGDDGEERDEQADGAADVPLSEDDAEVLGVPGEEHLREGKEGISNTRWYSVCRRQRGIHSCCTSGPYHGLRGQSGPWRNGPCGGRGPCFDDEAGITTNWTRQRDRFEEGW